MPFTFNGDWIPSEEKKVSKGPVKIRLEKRKQTIVTVIANLPIEGKELKELASDLKKFLGCGGGVKKDAIEVQGDHAEKVATFLKDRGIKAQCPSKKKR